MAGAESFHQDPGLRRYFSGHADLMVEVELQERCQKPLHILNLLLTPGTSFLNPVLLVKARHWPRSWWDGITFLLRELMRE
jgi:hypothetical protein